MGFKYLIKRILVLILFLVVIAGGLFLLRDYQNGEEYIGKAKTILSEKLGYLKAMIAPELDLSEDSGLDLSEVNLSAFVPDGASADKENLLTEKEPVFAEGTSAELGRSPTAGKEEDQEIVIVSKPLTLAEIQERIDEVAKETEEIGRKVERLLVLVEVQKEINAVAKKTGTISQQLSELRTLAEIQEKVDRIVEETNLPNQEIPGSA